MDHCGRPASCCADVRRRRRLRPAVAVHPGRTCPRPADIGRGRLIVIGAGKASAAMAKSVEDHWTGGPLEGLVVTRYGHRAPTREIEIVEAAHPVPDAAGTARCASAWRDKVSGLGAGRPRAVPDLRRRLVAAGPARRRTHAPRQAGDQPRAARQRRDHQRDELRAPPPLGDQGRAPGRGLPPGARADAADLRRARRRPDRHRLRPDRARFHHLRRRPRDRRRYGIDLPAAVRASCEAAARRVRQARRPAAGGQRDPHDRHAADGARSRRRARRARSVSRPLCSAMPSKAKRATSARCWPASRCRWHDTGNRSPRPACCCPAARPP